MFFSSSSADLKVIIFSLVIALVISLVIYIFKKRLFLSLFILSLLSNIIFYGNSGSELFDVYNMKWLVVFSLDIWPYINLALLIILIILYFKNKNEKGENN
jgi:hypothetical protein